MNFVGNREQLFLAGAGGSSRVDEAGRATNPRNERSSNLSPPSPAGTGSADNIASNPKPGAGVSINIELKFD
ncbi:MAG: hypothetical protein LBB81_06490 [Treponema sp.]|nr:hypothetical protein [Treponema sp.]